MDARERFHFDLHGYLLLRGVLTPEECAELLAVLRDLEDREFEDRWMAEIDGGGRPTRETVRDHQIRINGLPRLHPVFDLLIDHPRVLPYLEEFVGQPQLINTWSISKWQGAQFSGWHRGVPTTDYAYRTDSQRALTSWMELARWDH